MDEDTSSATMPKGPSGDLQVLALAEALVSAMDGAFDADGLDALRTVVEGFPGDPQSGSGAVAAGLTQLIALQLAAGRTDREALAVHVRAWRLMLTDAPPADDRALILKGLAAVRAHAEPPAKAA